ncbi:MAG: precorrin-4 C(11)-methyltransferase, partial [Verrucomicrobia bacterium]
MKPGVVTFCGAGPGAPDLLTVRAHRALREADVLVFAGSLVSPEVVACARPECERHDSAAMHLEAIVEILVDRARAGKRVLRLHTGDPSVYGAIAEQMRMLDAAGVPYETIPGVSAAFAAAAALNAELTLPGVTQTVVLSRMAGRTPVPEPESLRALSRIGATMALYLSVGRIESVVEELVAEGRYDVNTPVAVVYRVGWPDQRVVRGTLGDIAAKVREAGIGRQAVILVGAALSGAGESSLLYDAAFSHGFREGRRGLPGVAPAAPDETGRARFTRFGGRVAVYALTEAGCVAARRLAALLDAQAFVNRRFAGAGSDAAVPFDADGFADLVAWNWKRFDAHVFVMAAGIVVRVIARLLASKEHDPAVVVADECLQFAQSLLSGHLGGANRLCRDIERLSGAKAVISTATDTHGVCAWDEFAAMKGYQVADAASIAPLNLALLEKKPIAVLGADESDLEILRQIEHLRPVRRLDEAADAAAVVTIDCECPAGPWPRLHLKRLPLVVGVGCQRGV